MFCTTLRNRPLWAPIIPSLIEHPQLKLRETDLSTHDITLNLPCSRDGQSNHVRFLLLSTSSLHASDHQETMSRVERLSTLTGGRYVALIFLLSEISPSSPSLDGTHAFMELQLLLLNWSTSIPILPLYDKTSLAKILVTYRSSITTAALSVPPLNTVTALLPHCTTSAPHMLLSEHSANVLTDICSSFEDLAATVGAEEGKKRIEEYLDNGQGQDSVEAEGVIQFWEEEWIAE